MRRVGVLLAVLAISMILIINPSPYIDSCTIVDEPFTPLFSTAADGDVSSESIGEEYSHKFRETTDDDWLYYPDGGPHLEDYAGDMDAPDWTVKTADVTLTQSNPELEADIVLSTTQARQWYMNLDGYATPGDDFHITFWYKVDVDTRDLRVYIRNAADGGGDANGNEIFNPAAAGTWYYGVVNVSSGVTAAESVLFSVTNYDPAGNLEVRVKDFQVWDIWEQHTGYLENCNDVSDWTQSAGGTWGTDGDRMYVDVPKDAAYDTYYTNSPSITNGKNYYYEIRLQNNITDLYKTNVVIRWYSQDSMGGSWGSTGNLATTSAGNTFKGIITSDQAIECIYVLFYVAASASGPNRFYVDYLRIGPADEMGWQHDGSTTAGTGTGDGAGFTTTFTSDGDKLNCTMTKASGTGTYNNAYIYYDTTATKIDIERDHYPFYKVAWEVTQHTAEYGTIKVCPFLDGYRRSDYGENLVSGGATGSGIERDNTLPYSTATGAAYLLISWTMGAGDTGSITLLIDYAKFYSIANHTVTQSGAGTDDYLYVDSGVLYSSIDDGYIELNHDPALSVSDTYPVYNLTTSGTAPEFSQYVSEWSVYSDETRGATTSGTVADIKLKFDGTEIISAIKFIEDSTAPAVVRSSSTPNDPEDDEAITLSAVITDAVEVYAVAFNAIVYPTGFSDVDYDATEQADNLWTYEFSSLITGYYCFKIVATDGANDNALTEYAYIELSVREAAIRVEEITLIGAGSDFEMMTFSARINRDCSFTIYEESASSPESDTHTGSVSAPSFNLAWTKLDVDDSNVNFTIKFTSGSLTYNYTSQYQVAQTTFYISTVTQTVSLDTVTVTGRITKLGAYQVYDDLDVLKDYGSITDLDFKVQFTRWGGYDEQNHDFAIKFTNGSQTCWYNSSFYAFKKPVVAPFPIEDKNALYAFQASFWTALAATFILIMVAIDFYKRYWK